MENLRRTTVTYVTLVDTYVLCTFTFIAIVVLEVAVMEWVFPDGTGIADVATLPTSALMSVQI